MLIPPRALKIIPIAVAVLIAIGVRARAEQPIVVKVGLTCLDIQALAAWRGWPEIERRARSAGQSEAQIEAARKCLPSSSR